MRTFLRPFSAARRSAVLPRRAAAPLAIRLSSASYATDQHRAANAEEVDKEKKKHLERDPKDKEWSETLSSDSEAKVKATKDKRGPKELQKDTAAEKEKEQKS